MRGKKEDEDKETKILKGKNRIFSQKKTPKPNPTRTIHWILRQDQRGQKWEKQEG